MEWCAVPAGDVADDLITGVGLQPWPCWLTNPFKAEATVNRLS